MKALKNIMLAALICIAFCGITLSLEAKAADQWDGYTAVSTKGELNAVRNNLSGKYYLTADIVFTEEDFSEGGAFYNNGAFWVPIGNNSSKFTGTFNGNGHIISGLKINASGSGSNIHAGLFGFTQGAIISNLGITNAEINASYLYAGSYYVRAGIIAGRTEEGSITQCYSTGNLYTSANPAYVQTGGIVGSASNTAISNCRSGAAISSVVHTSSTDYSSYAYAGGIVGSGSYCTISSCYNTGNITVETSSDYWSSSANSYAGGVLGASSGCNVSNCYNTGDVKAIASGKDATVNEYAGGIAGQASQSGFISCCYTIGKVSGKNAGNIVGYLTYVSVSHCCYVSGTGVGVSIGTDTATACTIEQLKTQSTYTGFDFTNIWKMGNDSDYAYPTLRSIAHIEDTAEDISDFAGGNGSIDDPYKIETKVHLNNVRNHLGSHFILTADVIFSETDFADGNTFYNNGSFWNPIGDKESPFAGNFNGNGYSVYGLKTKITATDKDAYAGLFGYAKDAYIYDLKMCDNLIEVSYTGSSSSFSSYAGAIVGYGQNCVLTNCINAGAVSAVGFSGSGYAGGIAGCTYGGTINNCRNIGKVSTVSSVSRSTGYAGGIMGYSFQRCAVGNCVNKGIVSATAKNNYAGGIAAYEYERSTFTGCINTGSITAIGESAYASGIVGKATRGTISACCNTGTVYASATVTSSSQYANAYAAGIICHTTNVIIGACYNLGDITSVSSAYTPANSFGYAGGIAGYTGAQKITNSYNAGEISSTAMNKGYTGGITGYTNSTLTAENCYNIGLLSGTVVGNIAGSVSSNCSFTNCYYLSGTHLGVGNKTDTAVALTEAQMKNRESYAGFDFDAIWQMSTLEEYPFPVLSENSQLPVADQNLVFKSSTLTLYDNISVNFNIRKSIIIEHEFTQPKVKFIFMGKCIISQDYSETDDYYVFELPNIYAYLMDETITATIYATGQDGRTYCSAPVNYSVAEYCYNRLEKSTDPKMHTLAVDILNYGAASQVYFGYNTDALVNARLTPEQKLLASSDPVLKTVTNTKYEVIQNPAVTWKSAALVLENTISIRYKIAAASVEGLTLKLTNGAQTWTIDSSEFESNGDGTYYIYFSGLNATQFFDTIYATLYDESTAVSNTLTYSIESYAYSKQNSETAGLAELAKCIMRYGSSAKAYFEGM